jgi:hypothetical protein
LKHETKRFCAVDEKGTVRSDLQYKEDINSVPEIMFYRPVQHLTGSFTRYSGQNVVVLRTLLEYLIPFTNPLL